MARIGKTSRAKSKGAMRATAPPAFRGGCDRSSPRSDDDVEARAPSRKPLVVACVVMTAVVAFALYGLVSAFGTGAWITAPMLAVSLGWIIAAFRRVADARLDAKYRARVNARADALLAMMR